MEELLIYGDRVPPLYDEAIDQPYPSITPYFLEDEEHAPCILIYPGGAYMARADHEGSAVAKFFNECGFHAAVMNYRISPYRYPAGLLDAQRSVRFLRSRSAEFGIAADKIAVAGFSAGGHLAASSILLEEEVPFGDEVDGFSCRPDACILGYPVTLMDGEYHHRVTKRSLLGRNPEEALVQKMNLPEQMHADMPPCFLWHCADDESVPVENSLLFARALSQSKIPYELHVYPNGGHGIGLADGVFGAETWKDLCSGWLFQLFAEESYFLGE